MPSPYVRGKDFPTESGQPYDNLIAYGVKVDALPRFRGTGGDYYQLYCDIYLYDQDSSGVDGHYEDNSQPPYFLYKYVYWYCKVTVRPKSLRPVDGTPKIVSDDTKVVTVPGVGQRTVLARLGSYEIPTGIFLGITGYSVPGGSGFKIPADFGWRPQALDVTTNPETGEQIIDYGPRGFPGNGGATKDAYYDRDGSTNEVRINGGGDSQGGNPGDGDQDGTAGDPNPNEPPEPDPFPDINWFNKPTRWNPPLIGTATGAYVRVNLSGSDIDETEPPSRQSILGSGGIGRRNSKKGYLRQYIISAEDFRVNTGEQETSVENPDWDNNDAMIDLEKGWVYGFRFHYNPEQVAFSTLPVDNIDPAFLISGKEQAFPAFAQGASLSFPLYLNRIEDLNLLRGVDIRVAAKRFDGLYKGYNKKDSRLMSRNKDRNGVSKYAKEDIEGIKERGTGYDLEFLYRCAMGRPFPTALRGDTADLGIIIGLPMQLKLNEHLNYVGRLTGLSYNHVMFTQDMIPMLTVVNLQFTRIPDAQSFEGAKE